MTSAAAWLAIALIPVPHADSVQLRVSLSADVIRVGADLRVSLETSNKSGVPVVVRPHGEYLATEISFAVVGCAGTEVADGAVLQPVGQRDWADLLPGESLTAVYPFPISDLLSLAEPGPYSLVARLRLADGQWLASAPVAFTVEPLPEDVVSELVGALEACASAGPCPPEILVQLARVRLPEIRGLLAQAAPSQVAADPLLAAALASNPSPEAVGLLGKAAGLAPDGHARQQLEFLRDKSQRSIALEVSTAKSCDGVWPGWLRGQE